MLATTETFRVRLRGLGLSRQSVYARVFDDEGALHDLRGRLTAATRVRPAWPLRRLGFVNVLRYLGTADGGLAAAVRPLSGVELGELEVEVAEVVRTDKVFSPAGTTLIARVPLTRAT